VHHVGFNYTDVFSLLKRPD